MENLLEHLGRDTLPRAIVEEFVNWCVWEQARPALTIVLQQTGLTDLAAEIQATCELPELVAASVKAGEYARKARKKTGVFGLSTAEATAFLVDKLAAATQEPDWDPEGAAFFAAQVCGWAGFAETSFTDYVTKSKAEANARTAQENRLRELWRTFEKASDGTS